MLGEFSLWEHKRICAVRRCTYNVNAVCSEIYLMLCDHAESAFNTM